MKYIYKLFTNARFRKTMGMMTKMVLQQWFFGKRKKLMSPEVAEIKSKELMVKQARTYTRTAVELGGVLIKLGQHISSRVDVLPRDIVNELVYLQDDVAPCESHVIVARIEEELGQPVDKLFATFDRKPLAAASLGQVHVATLPTGEKVAVKVLRPNIGEIIETDLESLRIALNFLDKHTSVGQYADLQQLYEEFYNTLMDELDFEKEGNNAEEMALQFITEDWVIVPKIYWDFSTKKVLTMEFLDGIKINQFEKIDALGIDRKELALNFFEIYMQQVLVYGFFHADPHPGNVLVQEDGRIALLDFGMVGTIGTEMKEQIINMLLAVYLKDVSGTIDGLLELGFIRKGVDLEVFANSLGVLLDQIVGGSKKHSSTMSNQQVFDQLAEFLLEQPFQLPANTIFLGKALGTIASICTVLYPEFDIVASSRPYVEDMMKDDLVGKALKNIFDQVLSIVKDIIPTSKKMISVISKMEAGNLRVKIAGNPEDKIIAANDKNTNRIISAMIGAVIFFGGTQMLTTAVHDDYAHIVMGVGALVMFWQLRRRVNKRRERQLKVITNAVKSEAQMNPFFKMDVEE